MMSRHAKREYLDEVFFWYKYAKTKLEKNELINQASLICKYHRKHIIRLLNKSKNPPPPGIHKKRGPKPVYDNPELITALQRIWLAADMPCGRRLKAIIPLWLPSYIQEFSGIVPEAKEMLLSISASTVDRLISKVRRKYKRRGISTTKPGTLLKKQIPVKTDQWDESRPGFLEADTVAHCGNSLMGNFIYTIDTVDIATGWTQQRAIWTKSQEETLKQIEDIELSLPSKLRGFDCDNGCEFLNWHLLTYFGYRKHPIQFTRSRPYHKDDNAHIEQKNWTHVRRLLGYHRLDNHEAVPLLNDLYRNEWSLFHNFFSPSVKLISKEQINAKTIKKYDSPKTPYQRIMESEHIDQETKKYLRERLETCNPFMLKRSIEEKLGRIIALCNTKHQCSPKTMLIRANDAVLGNI